MSSLSSGENLPKFSPISALRKKLISAKISQQFRFSLTVKSAYVKKAWNAFRSGKEIKNLRYHPESEKYPIAL
jgi:hypothetical protein